MIVYKLFRIKKDGKLYPLFINKKVATPIGKLLPSEFHPTKGFKPRQGWHCCFVPYAPHLKEVLASGEVRVWVECEVDEYETYERPQCQGGTWLLGKAIVVNRILTQEEVLELRNAKHIEIIK